MCVLEAIGIQAGRAAGPSYVDVGGCRGRGLGPG